MCPQDWRVETLFLSLSPLSLDLNNETTKHLSISQTRISQSRFPCAASQFNALVPRHAYIYGRGSYWMSNNSRTSPSIIYYACTLYCTLSVILPHIWVERISFYISLDVQIKNPRWTQSHVGLGTQWGPNVVFADQTLILCCCSSIIITYVDQWLFWGVDFCHFVKNNL
jgi:hypothetical protein